MTLQQLNKQTVRTLDFRDGKILSHIFFAYAPLSDTQSSQDYVNAPKNDILVPADAPTKNDDTSNSSKHSSFRFDMDSTASTQLNNSDHQKDESTQDSTFSREK